MAIERYNSKTDVVVKLVLVFFVCLLSFSIGTSVGKKFSDNHHRMAQFEPAKTEAGETTAASESTNGKGSSLSDDEIAKLAEEFVNDDEKPADKVVVKVAEKATNKATEKPAEKTALAAVAAAAPVADKVAARLPSSLPKEMAATPSGKFTVQVGSFPTETEATKKVEDLKKAGQSAFFVEAKIKAKEGAEEKTWFRVSVGLFTTQKEAEEHKNDLIAQNKVTSAIVQKISK
jgi:cell division protein FtsN